MAGHEKSDTQPKKRSRGGLIFLMILLLLAGGVGYLYYSVVKAPIALDDPAAMVSSEPMAPEERYTVSSADQRVQVRMDTADLWCVILDNTGADFLQIINRELTIYGLEVTGCGIVMEETGLNLNLELRFRDIRLAAKVPCDLEFGDGTMTIRPTGVKLGVISLPVKNLLTDLKLELDLKLPVIGEEMEIRFVRDAVLLTGTMGADIRELVTEEQNLYQAVVFRESLRPLADAVQTGEGYAALLSDLEQDGGKVEELYRQLFTLAEQKYLDVYLEKRAVLLPRFFPGIDFAQIEEARAEMDAELNPQIRDLKQFFTSATSDYNDKKFKLKNGDFLWRGMPFQAEKYGGKDFKTLFQVLDGEEFYPVLVNVENGFIRNTSSFYRICDEDQQFTKEVNFNRTYTLGFLLRAVNGDPYIMYETETHKNNTYSRVITLRPLTEEQMAEMKVPGKFGVWTG